MSQSASHGRTPETPDTSEEREFSLVNVDAVRRRCLARAATALRLPVGGRDHHGPIRKVA